MATTYTDTTMGARAIGARTDSAGTPVTDVTAEEDRLIHEILTEGWVKPAASFQPVAGSAATLDVIIGSGVAKADHYLVEGDIAGQSNYLVRLAAATATVVINAADGSLARKDEIYLVVLDNAYDSTGLALPRLAYRDGTPGASPSAPGPDGAWDAYVLLATVDVPAAAADILACTITDERIAGTLAIGDFASDASATPDTIEPDDAAAEGVGTSFARADHTHGIVAGAASQLTPDLANAEGSATSFARSDHIHNVPAAAPGQINADDAAQEGSASTFARSDHQHAITTVVPVSIGATKSEGAGTGFVRNDHVHNITDMAAVGVQIGSEYAAPFYTVTGSWVDKVTISYVLPSGWSSALIVATGSALFRNVTNTSIPNLRIEIGASNGSTVGSSNSAGTQVQQVTLNGEHSVVVTGNVTLAVAVISGGGSPIMHNGTLSFTAIRAS